MHKLLIAVVLWGVVGASVHVADAAQQPFESVRLLGGLPTLDTVGFPKDIPRAQVLPTLIRFIYAVPPGQTEDIDVRRERLINRLKILSRADAAIQAWPSGLSVGAAREAQVRKRLESALDAFGLDLREQRNVYSVRLKNGGDERAIHGALQEAGVSVQDLVQRLNAGESVKPALAMTMLPIPLPRQVWQNVVVGHALDDSDWLLSILSDRRASLFAYGLLGTDGATRDWLLSTPKALKDALDHAAILTIAGAAFHLEGGRVDVPGGNEATAAWEAIVGEKVSAPEKFLSNLLSKDDGMMALFYETLQRLDPPRRRFAFGGVPVRKDALQALYDAFAEAKGVKSLTDRPFSRERIDGAMILRHLAVTADGELVGPQWKRFWETTFSSNDVDVKAISTKSWQKGGKVQASWIIDQVLSRPVGERDARLETFLVGQRLFPTLRDKDATDAVVTLRGYVSFPMLVLSLERLGVRTPTVYTAMTRAAARIDRVDENSRPLALYMVQGGVALIERLATRGALATPEAEHALVDLGAISLSEPGRIAEWVDTVLRTGLKLGDSEPQQPQLIRAIAGDRAPHQAATFVAEGETYAPAIDAAEARRMSGAMARESVPTVDHVTRFARALATARKATTVEALRQVTTDLSAQLTALPPPTVLSHDAEADLLHDARDRIKDLERITKPKDLKKIASALGPLTRLLDVETASMLRALAYAAFVPAEDVASLMDVAARHDFGLTDSVPAQRLRVPWTEPQENTETNGWHLRGSLLGLDAGIGRVALRRLSKDLPPHPPSIGEMARFVMTRTVSLSEATRMRDADRDAIASALAEGRRLAEAAVRSDDPSQTLRGIVTLSPWRREAIAWAATTDPEHVMAQFTAVDLLLLGTPKSPAAVQLDSWGTARTLSDGCLCVGLSASTPWESLAGRNGGTDAEEAMPDLSFRVAEYLAALSIPSQLWPSIMAFATQDALDMVTALSEDDVMAVSRYAAALTRDRVEDYVAAVAGRGLVTVVGTGATR